MVQIRVNGSTETYAEGISLADVLLSREIKAETARGVAVALNDRIVRKSDWVSTTIKAGSTVEIVTARQGG